MFIQKGDFPICLEVAFGLQPGINGEHCDTRHSDRLPDRATFSPAKEEEPRSVPRCPTSRPAAPAGGWLLRRPTSATGSGAIQLPIARGWGASPRRETGLMVVCLFVEIGPGGTATLKVKIAWNVSLALCRRLCQQAQETGWEAGTRPRSGPRVSPWSVCCRGGTEGDASRTSVPSV